jgi:hypothetical protein
LSSSVTHAFLTEADIAYYPSFIADILTGESPELWVLIDRSRTRSNSGEARSLSTSTKKSTQRATSTGFVVQSLFLA